jgi:hypothetical protein
MCTSDSSVPLRRAVDAVATADHERAFSVLDLLLIARAPNGHPVRDDLRSELDRLRTRLEEDGAR